MIRLVLADDHPIVLDGLESLFRLESDFQILARCTNGEEAVKAVRLHRPDVLLLDVHMAGKDGLAVSRELREQNLPTRIVLLAAHLDKRDVMEALQLGVRGILLKELAPRLVVQCVRKVHAGERWIEKRSHMDALDTLLRREAGMQQLSKVLTPREIELVKMVAAQLQNKEIATRLGISVGTVKIHLHNIYEKLNVRSRLELVLFAQSRGLV